MNRQPKPLTLGVCITQPRGTEGRLFRPNLPLETIGIYRVVRRRKDKIDIVSYKLDRNTEEINDLPLAKRLDDKVISAEELITYRQNPTYDRGASALGL